MNKFTQLHTYTHWHVNANKQIDIHTSTFTQSRKHLDTPNKRTITALYTRTNAQVRRPNNSQIINTISTNTHKNEQIHTHTHTHTYIHIHTHTYLHTHTYIHIHTYTHTLNFAIIRHVSCCIFIVILGVDMHCICVYPQMWPNVWLNVCFRMFLSECVCQNVCVRMRMHEYVCPNVCVRFLLITIQYTYRDSSVIKFCVLNLLGYFRDIYSFKK